MARRTPERAFWEKQVGRFRKSSLTAAAYADKIGVNVHTLQKWKYKLDGEAKVKPEPRQRGRPLVKSSRPAKPMATNFFEVEASVNASSMIEVDVAGSTIRVPRDVDEETLARVIRIVRGGGQ